MDEEKIFTKDEAAGAIEILKKFLLSNTGDELTAKERLGAGRILSEAQYSLNLSDP